MLDSLKKVVTAVKEGALEAATKKYLNKKIEKFGAVTRVEIDSRQKTVVLEASLKGEAVPVVVRVLRYEVVNAGDGYYIVPKQMAASREWISGVLNEYVVGQRLQIPASLKRLL